MTNARRPLDKSLFICSAHLSTKNAFDYIIATMLLKEDDLPSQIEEAKSAAVFLSTRKP